VAALDARARPDHEAVLDVLEAVAIGVDEVAFPGAVGPKVPGGDLVGGAVGDQPLEGLDDISLRPRDEALAIRILDTQKELTAVSLREEIVIESCADTADMQRSRRAGSKANAY